RFFYLDGDCVLLAGAFFQRPSEESPSPSLQRFLRVGQPGVRGALEPVAGGGKVARDAAPGFKAAAQRIHAARVVLFGRAAVPQRGLRRVREGADAAFVTLPKAALGTGQALLSRLGIPAEGRRSVLRDALAKLTAPPQVALGRGVALVGRG